MKAKHMQGYLIAMSGGVDSGTAAGLIIERNEGVPIMGVTLTMGYGDDAGNAADAAAAAKQLGIGHITCHCAERFRRDG